MSDPGSKKSRGNLAAAGRRKLDEFRRKKEAKQAKQQDGKDQLTSAGTGCPNVSAGAEYPSMQAAQDKASSISASRAVSSYLGLTSSNDAHATVAPIPSPSQQAGEAWEHSSAHQSLNARILETSGAEDELQALHDNNQQVAQSRDNGLSVQNQGVLPPTDKNTISPEVEDTSRETVGLFSGFNAYMSLANEVIGEPSSKTSTSGAVPEQNKPDAAAATAAVLPGSLGLPPPPPPSWPTGKFPNSTISSVSISSATTAVSRNSSSASDVLEGQRLEAGTGLQNGWISRTSQSQLPPPPPPASRSSPSTFPSAPPSHSSTPLQEISLPVAAGPRDSAAATATDTSLDSNPPSLSASSNIIPKTEATPAPDSIAEPISSSQLAFPAKPSHQQQPALPPSPYVTPLEASHTSINSHIHQSQTSTMAVTSSTAPPAFPKQTPPSANAPMQASTVQTSAIQTSAIQTSAIQTSAIQTSAIQTSTTLTASAALLASTPTAPTSAALSATAASALSGAPQAPAPTHPAMSMPSVTASSTTSPTPSSDSVPYLSSKPPTPLLNTPTATAISSFTTSVPTPPTSVSTPITAPSPPKSSGGIFSMMRPSSWLAARPASTPSKEPHTTPQPTPVDTNSNTSMDQDSNHDNNGMYHGSNHGNNGTYHDSNHGNNGMYQDSNHGNNGMYQDSNHGNNGMYQDSNRGSNGMYHVNNSSTSTTLKAPAASSTGSSHHTSPRQSDTHTQPTSRTTTTTPNISDAALSTASRTSQSIALTPMHIDSSLHTASPVSRTPASFPPVISNPAAQHIGPPPSFPIPTIASMPSPAAHQNTSTPFSHSALPPHSRKFFSSSIPQGVNTSVHTFTPQPIKAVWSQHSTESGTSRTANTSTLASIPNIPDSTVSFAPTNSGILTHPNIPSPNTAADNDNPSSYASRITPTPTPPPTTWSALPPNNLTTTSSKPASFPSQPAIQHSPVSTSAGASISSWQQQLRPTAAPPPASSPPPPSFPQTEQPMPSTTLPSSRQTPLNFPTTTPPATFHPTTFARPSSSSSLHQDAPPSRSSFPQTMYPSPSWLTPSPPTVPSNSTPTSTPHQDPASSPAPPLSSTIYTRSSAPSPTTSASSSLFPTTAQASSLFPSTIQTSSPFPSTTHATAPLQPTSLTPSTAAPPLRPLPPPPSSYRDPTPPTSPRTSISSADGAAATEAAAAAPAVASSGPSESVTWAGQQPRNGEEPGGKRQQEGHRGAANSWQHGLPPSGMSSQQQQQIKALQETVEELMEAKMELSRGLAQQGKLNENLADENAALMERYNTTGKALEAAQKKLKQYEAEIQAQRLALDTMCSERDTARLLLKDAQDRAAALAAEVVNLEKELLQAKSSKLLLEKQYSEHGFQLRSQEKQAHQAAQEMSLLQSLLTASKEEVRILATRLRELEASRSSEPLSPSTPTRAAPPPPVFAPHSGPTEAHAASRAGLPGVVTRDQAVQHDSAPPAPAPCLVAATQTDVQPPPATQAVPEGPAGSSSAVFPAATTSTDAEAMDETQQSISSNFDFIPDDLPVERVLSELGGLLPGADRLQAGLADTKAAEVAQEESRAMAAVFDMLQALEDAQGQLKRELAASKAEASQLQQQNVLLGAKLAAQQQRLELLMQQNSGNSGADSQPADAQSHRTHTTGGNAWVINYFENPKEQRVRKALMT